MVLSTVISPLQPSYHGERISREDMKYFCSPEPLLSASIQTTCRKKSRKNKKKVRFDDSSPHICEFSSGNANIWWTREELARSRCDFRDELKDDPFAQSYVRLFKLSYTRYCSEDGLSERAPLEAIAQGISNGYQGLERFSLFEVHRRRDVRNVIRSVVDAYQSAKERADRSKRYNIDVMDQVRAHSLNLTRKSSVWSAALGQAAHLGAVSWPLEI
jgi:hypothetical protein